MQYETVVPGRFLARPNRFIARVEAEGGVQTVRCRELLVPGAAVYLEKSGNPRRKTAYDLIAVQKGDLLINMDAQAPNRVFAEWLIPRLPQGAVLRREYAYGDSRLDFCVEGPRGRFLIEVKGVTLEGGGWAGTPESCGGRAGGGAVLRGADGGHEERDPQRRDPPGLRRGPAGGRRRGRAGVRVRLRRHAGEPGDSERGAGAAVRPPPPGANENEDILQAGGRPGWYNRRRQGGRPHEKRSADSGPRRRAAR